MGQMIRAISRNMSASHRPNSYLRIVPLVALERGQYGRLHLHRGLRLQLLTLALLLLPLAFLFASIVLLLA